MLKKLLLISTSKSSKPFFNYISCLRSSTTTAFHPSLQPFDNTDKIEYLHKKHNTSLSLTTNKNILTFTRTYDNQLLDTFEFILNFIPKSYSIDINPIHYTIMQNINPRLQNLLADFFTCQNNKVAIDGVKYVLNIKMIDNKVNISYEDINGNVVGPNIELIEKRAWQCEKEVWDNAVAVVKDKRIKNVCVDGMRDTIGTLHMEKQDLKEIQIKKARRVKIKE